MIQFLLCGDVLQGDNQMYAMEVGQCQVPFTNMD